MFVELLRRIKKRLIPIILVGVCLFLYTLGKSAYNNYYTAAVRISFVYAQIDDGAYPDGKRFSMMDMTSSRLVNKALKELASRGIFTDMTSDKISAGLSVSSFLPARASISSVRAKGYNYSYYANEYTISFSQQIDLHLSDPTDLFGLLPADYSQELVDELIKQYVYYFLETHTDSSRSFETISEIGDMDDMDYVNIGSYLDRKSDVCLSYLYLLQSEGVNFTASNDLTISDLINSFETLRFQVIQKLRDYVTASSITKDLQQQIYLYKYKIDTAELEMLKADDEYKLIGDVMEVYDQSYTQNMTIVTASDDELYQSRPKTGYDTLMLRAYTAGSRSESYKSLVAKYQDELKSYQASSENTAEYERMRLAAEDMISAMLAEYSSIRAKALQVIEEYLDYTNNGYYTLTDKTPNIILTSAVKAAAKEGLTGACAVVAVIAAIYFAGEFFRGAMNARGRGGKKAK